MKQMSPRRVAAIAMAAFALAGGLFAQSKTSSALTGTVVDESGAAVPGATVEAASPSQIGGARTTTTDDQGRFRFAEIAPGIYSVSVNLDGFQPVRVEGVTLALGQTQDLRVDVKVATVTETLVVTADAAVIDTSSSQSTTTLDNDYLQNLPTARFQPDVLNYAPGINDDNAYGAAGAGIAYQLDGIDTSDPEGGTAWSFVNYNIIEEVQLVGLGAPAEYGSFSGVVFNSITKSGGNEFKGLFDAYYSDDSLSDDISDEALADLDPRTEYFHDITGQVGGPIVQDRSWFFLSGEDLQEETTFGGPVRTEHDPRAFGKLTWQVNENNLFNGWFEWDRYDIEGRGASANVPLEATVTEDAPEYVGNLSWQSTLSSNTILNVAVGGYDGYYYLDPANGYDVAGHYDPLTGNYSVNSYYYYLADRTRNQLVASVSHFADDFIQGDHDFKFGMELERSTLRSRFGYPTGEWISDNYYTYYDDPGTPEYDPYQYGYGVYRGYDYDLEGTIERASFFAQDNWKISPYFTVNAGLRYEINHGKVPGEGKIFDNDALAPRLGFAWDLTKDGKTVLKAHWGRFFDKFVATQFYYANPGAYGPGEFLIRYPSGYEESFGQTTADTVVLDQDLDSPYQDQWTIGIDRELPGGMTLSFTYINREKKDFIETVSRDGIFDPVTGLVGWRVGNDLQTNGSTVTAYDYQNPETDVLAYRNPEGLHRKYEGYMLVLNKRLRDNWQGMFSYVYSEATGNADNNSFSGTLGGDNAGSWLNTPNSLINAEGHLTNDPTHQVKLQGTYIIPQVNLKFSGNYTYYSGDNYTLRASRVIVDGSAHSFNQGNFNYFGEPRGSRRLDPKNELDLRAEWYFHPGGGDGELGFFVDAFNVFNDARVTSITTLAGAAFEDPATANQPRHYRLGVRYSF